MEADSWLWPGRSLQRFDKRPISLSVSADIIPLKISEESDQSQSKHDALPYHPGNPFSWLRPAPPEAAGCFHLSSRGRLCCRRCVNTTLFHSWGCSFAYTPVIIASHLCAAASAAALRRESHLGIHLWRTFVLTLNFTMTPHANGKQKQFFGPLLTCPEPLTLLINPQHWLKEGSSVT